MSRRFSLVLQIVIFAGLAVPGWSTAKPLVLVSFSDVALIAKAIAGDHVELQVVLPPGADPHSFSVTSEQVRGFGQASLAIYAYSQYHEFEAAIKQALPEVPSLDWADYQSHGAILHDYPDYPQNPHGPWLNLECAHAMAQAIAAKLETLELPREELQRNLQAFEQELTAEEQRVQTQAKQTGLTQKPLLAVIPGVCDVISNLGIPVGGVLMAEGSGTVSGQTLNQAVTRLRSGQYGGLVCPLSMREAKQGEAARQIAMDTGTAIAWVHFLDTNPQHDSYTEIVKANDEAILSLGKARGMGTWQHPVGVGSAVLKAGVAGLVVLVVVLLLVRRRKQRPLTAGAGIFDQRDGP